MKRKTHIKQLMVILPLIFGMLLAPIMSISVFADDDDIPDSFGVNLTNLTYTVGSDETTHNIPNYTADETGFNNFVAAREAGTLDLFYTTDFLYDGVGKVVSPDLDDAIAAGNDSYTLDYLDIKVLNINATGNIKLKGDFTGMLALDTNDLMDNVTLTLDGVNLDSGTKKAPAIYVYNKDTTYEDYQVTISSTLLAENTIKGGKFKKVSLLPSDDLASYAGYYSTTKTYCYEVDSACTYYSSRELFDTYTNYYGIYTAEQLENIRFATVKASQENLNDADPYNFYKGAGAISSDIDLTFQGDGYLEVTSKNKEGVETKGNLTFAGSAGTYVVRAMDDALNTTTKSSDVENAHNTITIDVGTLVAIVDPSADEGDAIDSNGELIINFGTVFAFAHPTSPDDGLDSEKGTFINGGTVLAIGNMADPVSTDSEQDFLKAAFQNKIAANTPVVITDASGNYLTAFMTDRTFSVLTYSSEDLAKGNYLIYTGGVINGEADTMTIDGTTIYTSIASYSGGTLAQTVTADTNPGNTPPDGGGDQPTPPTPTPPVPDDGGNQPTPPAPTPDNGNNNQGDNSSNNNNSSSNSTDDEDIPVPNTSDTTSSTVVSVPNTGRKVKNATGVKSVPTIAWAISGCSAVTLVLYVLISRKRHAIKFRR